MLQKRSMARRAAALALAVVVELTAATRAASPIEVLQDPAPATPTFGAGVDLILVDAIVTDRQGRLVKGLSVEDFVVREDGEPQALTSFEAVDLQPVAATTSSPVPRWSVNDEKGETPRRVFLVVMDDAGLGLESAIAARTAAKRFLSDATRSGDLVTLVAPEAGLMWVARIPRGAAELASIVDSVVGRRAASPEMAGDFETMQAVQGNDPFTQERARLRLDAAGQLPRAARFPGESEQDYDARNRSHQQGFLQADARRQLERDRERRHRLFASVSAALEAHASVKGRKSVLLFSEGFVREPNDPGMRDLVAALRRRNASIYYVDARRLSSGLAADSRQAGDRSASTRVFDPRESTGAEVVAEETGGFTLRSAELETGLARVAEESSSYYLLGYSPTNTRRDGKYRRLQVEVRRAGLEVRARKGYYGAADPTATVPAGKRGPDPALESTLASAVPARDIPLRLAAVAQQAVEKGKVRVRVVAEVGVKGLHFEPDGDGSRVATLDVALALNHVQAAGRQRTPWREWKVKLPARVEAAEVWVPLEGAFEVPAGACQARVAVRDRGSHAEGSVVHALAVPDPAAWRVSTPILSEVPGEARDRAPRMPFDRSFVSGSQLYCFLEVYGGAKAKAVGPPRVSLAYTLVDAQGKVKKDQPAVPLDVSAAGIPTRLETIPLSGLKAGAYELRLHVRDEVKGRTEELRETFVVTRPTRPDLAIYLELLHAFQAGESERAASGVIEWRPRDLETLATSLPREDVPLRQAALDLHKMLAFRLWSHARAVEADAQVAIGRAVLAKEPPPGLLRDWLLDLGYYHLAAATPAKALPFFAECARAFPDTAEAWLGAGIANEVTAFPDGFVFAARPVQGSGKRAERCYREASRLDPGLSEARLRLGRVLGLSGATADAEKELAAVVESAREGPVASLAHVFWGGVREAKGDVAGALRHYEAALVADGQSQMAALALSEALHRSGRHRQAAERLAAALAVSGAPEVSPWHAYHLGPAHRRVVPASPTVAVDVAPSPEP